jgi:F0F1-type ATP synthase epsilon subunit
MTPSKPLLTLNIKTPEGLVLEKDNLTSVNVMLSDGASIGIRPGHAPLIAETKEGILKFHDQENQHVIDLLSGILEIRDNRITILTIDEMNETEEVKALQKTMMKFDRLMKTLVGQTLPEDGVEND